MAVKIRLKRMGKIRTPFYRVVIMDSRTKRDGRAIEEIGKYHPTEEPSVIDIDPARAAYWLAQGAQPTEAVEALLKSLELKGAATTVRRKPAKAEAAVAEITDALAAADKPAETADAAAAEGDEA